MCSTHSKTSDGCLHPSERVYPAGVMGFDSLGGFYLQHSTPRFPDDPVKGKHKSSGEYTGETRALLLCTAHLSLQAA